MLGFGSAFAVVGAAGTIVVLANMQSVSFALGMDVLAPSLLLTRALGIRYSGVTIPWLASLFAAFINAALCFMVGALVALVVYYLTKRFFRGRETAG